MKATPRTTSRYAKRKIKPEPIKIRWKKILTLPILVLVITLVLFGVKFALDQNDLMRISKITAQYSQQLIDYRKNHINEAVIKKVVAEADVLASGYMYETALEKLKANADIQLDTTIIQRIARYQKAIDELVVYSLPVRNLVFHNMIVYPEIAFGKTSHAAQIYKDWYVTSKEFKAILDQLYARGFVLVDFFDIYEEVNGKMVRKELKLPAGKTPLILSIDELAYPDPKPLDGFARGLAIKDGEIVSRVMTVEGVEKTTDGDAIPIVESFLKEHPDFSYRGGRGILGITGYAGTLGFRLATKTEVSDATNLATILKEKGWIFACSSYSDSRSIYYTSPDAIKVSADLVKWKKVLGPIVGDTILMVSPYGNVISGANLVAVKNAGYKAVFIVDRNVTDYVSDGMLYLPRVDINGISFAADTQYLNQNFFNVREVIDPARPK